MVVSELFPPLSADAVRALGSYFEVLPKIVPLSQRHRRELPGNIRELWHDLTDERASRPTGYMAQASLFSAYLHYFLPWNLYRYSRFFSGPAFRDIGKVLGPESAGVVSLIDIGSGPLTVPIALFIARPELRKRPLTIVCTDRAGAAMETGEGILARLAEAITGSPLAWKIERVTGDASSSLRSKAMMVSAANVLNELFWTDGRPSDIQAKRHADYLSGLCVPGGRIVVLEAGIPRSGEHVARMRAELVRAGIGIVAPCPHVLGCPAPGSKSALPLDGSPLVPVETIARPSLARPGLRGTKGGRGAPEKVAGFALPVNTKVPWCHFNLGIEGAPARLSEISAEAGLPKEGVSLTVLVADKPATVGSSTVSDGTEGFPKAAPKGPVAKNSTTAVVRILSEEFRIPGGWFGRYACSAWGYTLVRYRKSDGGKGPSPSGVVPGALVDCDFGKAPSTDEKSGAVIASIAGREEPSGWVTRVPSPDSVKKHEKALPAAPVPEKQEPGKPEPIPDRKTHGDRHEGGKGKARDAIEPQPRERWKDAPAWVPHPGKRRGR
jgi:hypothetical protein